MALGFRDGSIQVVNPSTGEMIREFGGAAHSEAITSLAISHDGLRLASGSQDALVVCWEANTGTNLGLLEHHTLTITSVVWLDSDQKAGTTQRTRSGARRLKRKAVARVLATSSMDRSIRLYEEKSTGVGSTMHVAPSDMRYELIWEQQWLASPILSLAYDMHAHTLTTGVMDGGVKIFDAHAPNLGLISISSFSAHKSVVCGCFPLLCVVLFVVWCALSLAPPSPSLMCVWVSQVLVGDMPGSGTRRHGHGHGRVGHEGQVVGGLHRRLGGAPGDRIGALWSCHVCVLQREWGAPRQQWH